MQAIGYRAAFRSAGAAFAVGVLSLAARAMGQTADLVIDSFQYASPAEAQANWIPASAAQPVMPTSDAGVPCLSLPLAFTVNTVVGYWDRAMNLDLSTPSMIAVRLKSTRPSMQVSLMFQTSDGGWYWRSFWITDRWWTYEFSLNSFGQGATTSGWNTVTKIRLAFWQDADPSPATACVSDLRAGGTGGQTSVNLLSNSGFELTTSEAMPDCWGPSLNGSGAMTSQWVLDTNSWRARWGVDRTVNHTPGGTNSLRIVGATASPGIVEMQAIADIRPPDVGDSTLSAWLLSSTANLPVTLQVYGGTPAAATSVRTSSTPNTWQRYTLNVPATAYSSSQVSCIIYPTGNGTLWVDDVQFEKGAVATAWQRNLTDADMKTSTVHKVVPPIGDVVVTPGGDSVTVSTDADGRFLVDGQPYIPMAIGWTGPLPSAAMMRHFAQAGFNSIVPLLRAYMTLADIRTFLDGANANGLKVVAWLERGMPITTMESWIVSLKDHPAIIAWYVYDEPGPSAQWLEANAKYAKAKEIDPSRPAMVNLLWNFNADWASDILSLDHYPIGSSNNINTVGGVAETLHRTAVKAGKPAWIWLQSYGYIYGMTREPTGAEAECMAYMALIHGTRGLMYFAQKPRLEEQWNELRTLTDEVNELTPVLYSTDTTPSVSADAPSIHVLSKTFGGKRYLIAVNESPLPVTTTLTSAEAGSALAATMFENRNVNVLNGQITDTFAGYQRHVYSFTELLVAHLNLDATSGVIATDSSGYGHNGALFNGPTWTNGKVGGALGFDGIDDYVVTDGVAVNTAPGGSNTVAFWMKWNGANTQMPFGWNQAYDLFLYNGSFGINTGESNILGLSSAGMAGQWVHVAVVFPNGVPSTSNAKMFINGVAQPLTARIRITTASRSATPRFFISGWGATPTGFKFGGEIDDLRVYNHALTAGEVAALAVAP